MDATIIAQAAPVVTQYHRIDPILFHRGNELYIANGIMEVDGIGYLGWVRADVDSPADFLVAPFIQGHDYYTAPANWPARVLATAPVAVELAVAA